MSCTRPITRRPPARCACHASLSEWRVGSMGCFQITGKNTASKGDPMMRSRIFPQLALGLLAAGVMAPPWPLGETNSALAATPRHVVSALPLSGSRPALRLSCGIPNSADTVGCTLSGRGFRPRERVRITYRLSFTALPRVQGHLQGKVYTRIAATDARGAFDRPPLRFAVVRFHESFRLTATAVGASGDRATITTAAAAQ